MCYISLLIVLATEIGSGCFMMFHAISDSFDL